MVGKNGIEGREGTKVKREVRKNGMRPTAKEGRKKRRKGGRKVAKLIG